jgi:hypothetical protein
MGGQQLFVEIDHEAGSGCAECTAKCLLRVLGL